MHTLEKTDDYALLLKQVEALVSDEPDDLANLANDMGITSWAHYTWGHYFGALQALGINDGPASLTVRLQASAGGAAVGTQSAQLTVTNTAPQSVLRSDRSHSLPSAVFFSAAAFSSADCCAAAAFPSFSA